MLFDQLNLKGLSYQTVCQMLLKQGVKISPQALRSWHLRRSRKIAHRSSLLTPLIAIDEKKDMALLDYTSDPPYSRPKLNDPDMAICISPIQVDSALRPIQDRIRQEEQNLLSHSIGTSGYLVRKKPVS